MFVLVVVTILMGEEGAVSAQNVDMQEFSTRRSCDVAERSVRAMAPNIRAMCYQK